MGGRGDERSPARFAFLDHPVPSRSPTAAAPPTGWRTRMAAFGRAVDLGYRYLETDVHATADGVLLAFHDRTLDRVTDRSGEVAQLPWREVRQARIGGLEPIPTLEELLGGLAGRTGQRGRQGARRRRSPWSRSSAGPGRSTGCASRPSRRAGWPPYAAWSARGCARRWRRAARRAAAPGRPATRLAAPLALSGRSPCAQLPARVGRLPVVTAGRWSTWPIAAACACTSGPSTTPPRCTGCSTWASTA